MVRLNSFSGGEVKVAQARCLQRTDCPVFQISGFNLNRRLSVIGHWSLVICAICLCLCAGAACASRKPKPQGPPQPTHRLVGTIVMVNEEQKFVLIDTDTAEASEDGTALKSFSNGAETGVLTVSPEHRPPFMIADIVSGTPQKGDQVFE
jgi:hypothetical protein